MFGGHLARLAHLANTCKHAGGQVGAEQQHGWALLSGACARAWVLFAQVSGPARRCSLLWLALKNPGLGRMQCAPRAPSPRWPMTSRTDEKTREKKKLKIKKKKMEISLSPSIELSLSCFRSLFFFSTLLWMPANHTAAEYSSLCFTT